jgi:hypothetical protein
MPRAFSSLVRLSLLLLACSCSTSHTRGDEAARTLSNSADARSQSETEWLRAEVQGLRGMLAERDRRDTEILRAYVALSQRVDQLLRQQALTQTPLDNPVGDIKCEPTATSGLQSPPKSLIHAINRSHLSEQEKRTLLQSMKPPRAIDNANPWLYSVEVWPSDVTNEASSR